MALILAIETTTKNCSVALFNKGILLQLKEEYSDSYSHAENLTLFINEVLIKENSSINKLDAIAVSKGPGSYTGLRIGTSTAKGLCYSSGIPLIAISTLKAMALGVSGNQEYDFYCPMIDARRMEVFAAIFDDENNQVRDIMADVVDANIYKEYLDKKVLFFGDGAMKCQEMIKHKNATYLEGIFPSAKNMGILLNQKFENKDFEDVAYFEPFYLKDFVAGKKKV